MENTAGREARRDPKPMVLTIHGVCPDRSWQKTVKRVFEPHFDCPAIDYSEYDCWRGGALKAVIEPVLLLGSLALAVMAYGRASLTLTSLALALFLLGLAAAGFLRARCASSVKAQISTKSAEGVIVHVVAHSFGTYIAARALRHADVDFRRIVFVGSVLPRRLNWMALLRNGAPDDASVSGFLPRRAVRNEVGSSDVVVLLAKWTSWLSRGLGGSGRAGFFDNDHTRTENGPWDFSESFGGDLPIRVVNVPLSQYGHSTHFLGPGHALKLWLPFFWGYPPGEFQRWIETCWIAASLLQANQDGEFRVLVTRMKSASWPWTADPLGAARTLNDDVKHRIAGRRATMGLRALTEGDLQAAVDETMTIIVNAVQAARQVAYGNDPAIDAIRWRLNPKLAVSYSVADQVKQSRDRSAAIS